MSLVSSIISGFLRRIVIMLGPCSIHSEESCYNYCVLLGSIIYRFYNVFLFMRVYLEKPRTVFGWKGFVYDPDLNYTYNIGKGLKKSMFIISFVGFLGLSFVTEFLSPILFDIMLPYFSLFTIGARTSESQIHREMACKSSIPVGFKNNIYGDFLCSINSIIYSLNRNICYDFSYNGFKLYQGNRNCFLILRGGTKPNYYVHIVKSVFSSMRSLIGLSFNGISIDLSHGNSGKCSLNQLYVFKYVFLNILSSYKFVFGIMVESHVFGGRFDLGSLSYLDFNVSITDDCLSWRFTLYILYKCSKLKSL